MVLPSADSGRDSDYDDDNDHHDNNCDDEEGFVGDDGHDCQNSREDCQSDWSSCTNCEDYSDTTMQGILQMLLRKAPPPSLLGCSWLQLPLPRVSHSDVRLAVLYCTNPFFRWAQRTQAMLFLTLPLAFSQGNGSAGPYTGGCQQTLRPRARAASGRDLCRLK